MGNSFQFSIFTCRQEWELIFDIGRAGRIVAKFIFVMFAKNQTFFGQAKIGIPFHAAVTPVLVPLLRTVRVTEKLDFHLFEFARAKCEIPWSDLIAKAFAHLSDSKRNAHSRTVENILEVYKDSLSRFRS